MAQKNMYPGMVNSPETTLTNGISESDTIIYVLDPTRVPEPPNLMTLGTGTNAETIKVTEINDSAITVERGFQGIAKSWPAGTVIARNFTEYDYQAMRENIDDLDGRNIPLNKLDATTDPGASNDSTEGYSPGSLWVNVTDKKAFVCTDATEGAAVWEIYTGLGSHLSDYVLQVPYGVATGSANTYAVTLSPAPTAYVDGMAIAVKINVENTGASTINVNNLGAKTIKKPNGNDVSAANLKAGSIYSMRYNGTNFILQGSDAAGNATPGDVLSGKTFSSDMGTDLVGEMPNRGAYNITPGTSPIVIPNGYHNGGGQVASLGGNAEIGDVLFGKTFSSDVAGRNKTGTYVPPGISVQSGTTYFSTTSHTINITSVDLSKSFLIFNYQDVYTGTAAIREIVRGYLSAINQITFEKLGNVGTAHITWFVVTSNLFKVQRFIGNISSGSTYVNIPIDAINLSKTFIVVTWKANGDYSPAVAFVSGEFTSTTNLRLRRGASNYTASYACEVVECLN